MATNPNVRIETHETALTSANALDLLAGYDIVVDGTDNFPTRYLVNDACVLLGRPNVYGSIFRFEGQASVFAAPDGPCYRCLYPEPPPPGLVPSCAEGGVLGVLPGIVGTIQATETIKLILGAGEPLVGRLLMFDALRLRFREFKLQRDPDCPVCGERPSIRALIDYEEFCGVGHAQAASDTREPEVTSQELKALLDRSDRTALVDVREPHEAQICHIPGAVLVPLGDLPKRVQELDATRRIIVHCRTGQRSARAVAFLRSAGFDAWNLRGGILDWIDKVDPSQPKY
jgi:adenylyltransferase/sulfurtransferase